MKFKNTALILSLCFTPIVLNSCGVNFVNEDYQAKTKEIYNLAKTSGIFLGTYEEWLASIQGEDGVSILDITLKSQTEKEVIYNISLSNGTNKEIIIPVVKGDAGKSAYEIYKEKFPDYTKSEAEWLDDLVNGRLGNKQTHVVNFETGDGTRIDPQIVNHGEKLTKPADLKKEHYIFEGWEYKGELWSFVGYVVTENMTLTPRFKKETYTINIKYNNDDFDETRVLEYGENLTLNNPLKPGHRFTHFEDKAGNIINFPLKVTSNIDIIAKYSDSIDVSFTLDGKQVAPTTSYKIGTVIDLPLVTDFTSSLNDGWHYIYNGVDYKASNKLTLDFITNIELYIKKIVLPTNDKPLTKTSRDIKGEIVYLCTAYRETVIALEEMVAEFNKIYPNIKVKIVGTPAHMINDELTKSINDYSSLPNLVETYSTPLDDLYNLRNDMFVDLTYYLEDEFIGYGKIFDSQDNVIVDRTTSRDDIFTFRDSSRLNKYFLPNLNNNCLFLLNETIFNDPSEGLKTPTNWSEVLNAARTFKNKHPERFTNGINAPIMTLNLEFLTYQLLINMYPEVFAYDDTNNDGTLSKDEGFKITLDQLINLYSKFISWYQEGLITTGHISEYFGGIRYPDDALTMENPSSIMMHGTENSKLYLANNAKHPSGSMNTDLFKPIPFPGTTNINQDLTGTPIRGKLMTSYDAKVSAIINKDENSNKCAWLFYKFINNKDNQVKYFVNNKLSGMMSRKSSYEDPRLVDVINKKDMQLNSSSTAEERLDRLNGQILDIVKTDSSNNNAIGSIGNKFTKMFREIAEEIEMIIYRNGTDQYEQLITRISEEITNIYNRY